MAALRIRSALEREIYAAVFSAEYVGRNSVDNSVAENAIAQAEWAVECHRRAVRERKRWDR